MKKEDEIKIFLEGLNHDIDNIFWIFQVKLAGLYEIRRLKEDYVENIGVTSEEDSTLKIHFIINITKDKLESSYKLLETEARRAYITDLYLILARYSILLRGVIDDKKIIDPSLSVEIIDKALELLNPFLNKEEKAFLVFFHKVRNSLIHHDGNHNKKNALNYVFCGITFQTSEQNIGQQIEWGIRELLELYNSIKSIYNSEKFLSNEFLRKSF
jgi:hypothetical protein